MPQIRPHSGSWHESDAPRSGLDPRLVLRFQPAILGPIGLQGLHGAAQAPVSVYYRNLKIKALD